MAQLIIAASIRVRAKLIDELDVAVFKVTLELKGTTKERASRAWTNKCSRSFFVCIDISQINVDCRGSTRFTDTCLHVRRSVTDTDPRPPRPLPGTAEMRLNERHITWEMLGRD